MDSNLKLYCQQPTSEILKDGFPFLLGMSLQNESSRVGKWVENLIIPENLGSPGPWGALWRGPGSDMRTVGSQGWGVCVCVCWAQEVRMGRRQVGSQRSPWESLWVEGVSSQSPWTGVAGRAGTLWSVRWGSRDCWRWREWKTTWSFSWLRRLSHVLEIWPLLEPWPHLPCCWVMSWNYVYGQTSPRGQAGLRNYFKKWVLHPTQS